jgi:hypothetical protein
MEEIVRLVSDFLASKSLVNTERALRTEFQMMLSSAQAREATRQGSDEKGSEWCETVQAHNVYTSEVGCCSPFSIRNVAFTLLLLYRHRRHLCSPHPPTPVDFVCAWPSICSSRSVWARPSRSALVTPRRARQR